jgi:hypothetical protein
MCATGPTHQTHSKETQTMAFDPLTELRDAPEQVANTLAIFWRKRVEFATAAVLSVGATPEQVAAARANNDQLIAQMRDQTLAALADLRGDVAGWQRRALAEIAAKTGRPAPADSASALLREQRTARAWTRQKEILAAEGATAAVVGGLAADALATGDDDALDALRQELPAHMRAASAADSAALPEAQRPEFVRAKVTEATAALDRAIGEARPAFRAALALRQEIEAGAYRVGVGIGVAEHAIQTGALVATVPAWSAADGVHVVKADPVAVGN